jgi:dUTP pyrophosphatase
MSAEITIRMMKTSAAADLPLPKKMTEQAAGFDLCAAVPQAITIPPGHIAVIPCGFHMALPPGYEAQIRPRSGIASRNGVTPVNSPGTIDSDYRGEVMTPLVNLGHAPFVVERGMRIAQMLVAPVPKVKIVEVKQLDETKRGAGGFGHTGTGSAKKPAAKTKAKKS